MSDVLTDATPHGERWLSREFSELLGDSAGAGEIFDALIVGSGYGGAVAAAVLSGCRDQETGRPMRVAVLERGREYLPGSFPSQMAEAPTHVRGSALGQSIGGEGLFDVRAGGDVSVLVANGLGGGSLINAGVMEAPAPAVFERDWPTALTPEVLAPYLARALEWVGGAHDGVRNTIAEHRNLPPGGLAKQAVLKVMADAADAALPPARFRGAAITVAMRDRPNRAGVLLKACKLCGDCASGCNYAAKESLDTNLLVQAARRGAEIWCGATVTHIEKDPDEPGAWRVAVVHTDEKMRLREGPATWLRARRLILAAGTLGSTELLMRSQLLAPDLVFSPLLGKRFSTNGDLLAFGYDYAQPANAMADEDQPPLSRGIGPTITGVVEADVVVDGRPQTITIEEMAVPGALKRLTGEMLTTAATLQAMAECDHDAHDDTHPLRDPLAVNPKRLHRTSIFAAMGDDGAKGLLQLGDERQPDGQLRVVWPQVREHPLFDAQLKRIAAMAAAAKMGGRTLPNPLWRPLPANLAELARQQRGPLLTVHPLGGCVMGDCVAQGVVDSFGCVFDAAAPATSEDPHPVHAGLLVLDGAMVPSSLSINPALTIAALALRAAEHHRDHNWRWTQDQDPTWRVQARPQVADVEAQIKHRTLPAPLPTRAEFTERLFGTVHLDRHPRGAGVYGVEITLTYLPTELRHLYEPDADGALSRARLQVSGAMPDGRPRALLRIIPAAALAMLDGDAADPDREKNVSRIAEEYELEGSLTILRRAPTGRLGRLLRTLPAWWRNRGARDLWQLAGGAIRRWRDGVGVGAGPGGLDPMGMVRGILAVASRAGEVRRFEYDLKIVRALGAAAGDLVLAQIRGSKRITYGRPSNPWRQLQEMNLDQFPGLRRARRPPVLKLDLLFLARRVAPLMRLEQQADQVRALADVASLSLLFLRMVLSIHFWNGRKPDAPRHRPIQRLPLALPGLPAPQIHELEVDRLGDQAVHLRLIRYRAANWRPQWSPVVMFHGYSASGTTFAHRLLPHGGLAGYLARAGREVWVVDFRSSCGMPMAQHPWTFERVALMDVPAAIDFIWWQTGQRKLDVIAHCMGAAMFGMAVLSAHRDAREIFTARDQGAHDRYRGERRALPGRIRRAVLSQIGPVMVFSPENTFRSFVASFFEHLLGPLRYEFRAEPADPGLAAELFDRLLSSLPYPDEELLRENGGRFWRPVEYARSRHRMDALYGRTFTLGNLGREVLAHLDDFFGPISLDSVAQVTHFAQLLTVTDRSGRNRFVTDDLLRDHWRFPTLGLHGADNGLADAATLERMRVVLREADCHFEPQRIDGYGHQDCLIGERAGAVFARAAAFLAAADTDPRVRRPAPAGPRYVARPPWLGPMLARRRAGADAGRWYIGLGAAPGLAEPVALYLCPVTLKPRKDGTWSATPLPPVEGASPHQRVIGLDRTKADWFAAALPDWTQDPALTHLALLLIYPQPEVMDEPVSGAGSRPWSDRRTFAQGLERAGSEDRRHQEIRRAVDTTLNRRQASLLDLGILSLPRGPARTDALCLALGSCQYPPGILDPPLAYASWDRLNRRLDTPGDHRCPELMVLTGDQVYVDATAGLIDPRLADDRYRKPYEAWLRSRPVRQALGRIELVTLPDDHEIDDNWEPIAKTDPACADNQAYHRHGVRQFRRFQRPADEAATTSLSFSFERNGVPIFMLDTRTERQFKRSALETATGLIDPAQWIALTQWLLQHRDDPRPRLIVSSSALLPRHRRAARTQLAVGQDCGMAAALRSDGWDGYPQTWLNLLAFIARHRLQRLVFLSGDQHLGLLSTATLRRHGDEHGVRLHSIHAPGLYVPFVFANASPADLIADETFAFQVADGRNAESYSCEVKTRCVQGEGFVIVALKQTTKGWTVDVEFDIDPRQARAGESGAFSFSLDLD